MGTISIEANECQTRYVTIKDYFDAKADLIMIHANTKSSYIPLIHMRA